MTPTRFIAKDTIRTAAARQPCRRENRRIYVACDLDDLFLLALLARAHPALAVGATCATGRSRSR